MVDVVTIHEGLYEKYSAYIAGKPGVRFGHDLEWALALQDTYGVSLQHLVALENGNIVGVCPLFLCKPILGGAHYLTSLFPSYFGPLYDSQHVLDVILDSLIARTASVQYAEIISPVPVPDEKRLPHLEQLDFTYRLSLNATAGQLFKKFRRNFRRILNDPKSHDGMDIIVSSDGSLVKDFYGFYSDLYTHKHGFIPHVENLFHKIYSYYHDETVRIYMARHNGRYIGGIFTFWKYGEVYCGWSALDISTSYSPMHFLIWQIIQDGVAQEYQWFNHGEAPRENESLKLFKQGWGMEPSDTYRYFIPGRLSKPIVRAFDRFSWTKRIISVLPTTVTTSLISPLIRYIL